MQNQLLAEFLEFETDLNRRGIAAKGDFYRKSKKRAASRYLGYDTRRIGFTRNGRMDQPGAGRHRWKPGDELITPPGT